MAPRIKIGVRASRPIRPLETDEPWELARLGGRMSLAALVRSCRGRRITNYNATVSA